MKKRSVSQTPPQRTAAKSKEKLPVAALPAQPTATGIERARHIAELETRAFDAFCADQEQARRELTEAFAQGTQEALGKGIRRSQATATRNRRTQQHLQRIVDDGGEHVWLPPRREEIPVVETLPDGTQRTRTVLRLHREKSRDALFQRITRRYPTAEHLAHASADLAQKTGQPDDAYNHARQHAVEGLYAESIEPFLQAIRDIGPQLLTDPEINGFVQEWWVAALDEKADYTARKAAGRNMDALRRALDVRGGGNTRKLQEQERITNNRKNNAKARQDHAIRQYRKTLEDKYRESKAALERQGRATETLLRQQISAIRTEELTSHAGAHKREAFQQFAQWAQEDIARTARKN